MINSYGVNRGREVLYTFFSKMIIVIIIYNIILIIKKIITFTINNIINMFIMVLFNFLKIKSQ